MKTLDDCRVAIDSLDNEMLELLNKRMKVVERVGEIKHNVGGAIYRPEREKDIIQRLVNLSLDNDGLLNQSAIEAIFLEVFAVSRNLELPEKIAYLGPEGSFTHQAAESRFGAMSDYLSLGSIHSVFKTLESSRAKFGVVPIENSRDGIVGETLDLLAKSSVKIVAELYMPIHMSFATQAVKLEDITKYTENIETISKKELGNLSQLDQSILFKAFRGELVPQDPNDEPASQLLERIKQEKVSLEAGKKQKRKVGRKKKVRKKEETAGHSRTLLQYERAMVGRPGPQCGGAKPSRKAGADRT